MRRYSANFSEYFQRTAEMDHNTISRASEPVNIPHHYQYTPRDAPRTVRPLFDYEVVQSDYSMNRDKTKVQFRSRTQDFFSLVTVIDRVIYDKERGFFVLYFNLEDVSEADQDTIQKLDDAIASTLLHHRMHHCYKVLRRIQPNMKGSMELKLKFYVKDSRMKISPTCGLTWESLQEQQQYYQPVMPLLNSVLTEELPQGVAEKALIPGRQVKLILEVCQPWCMKNEKTCDLEMGNYLRVHAIELMGTHPRQTGPPVIEGF